MAHYCPGLTSPPATLTMSAMRIRLPVSGCLLLSVVCLSSIAFAQTNWARTYGRPGNDRGSSVQQTRDGGFIVAGSTESLSTGDNDVYLIRTDAHGDTLWTRSYGGTHHDFGYSVRQTSDGGYIVAGSTSSFGTNHFYDVYLIKTDAEGDTIWTRAYGGQYDEEGNSVQQTADGGYIIAGYTVSFGAGYYDLYLIKTDASGDTLWTRSYGRKSSDGGNSVQQTSDGGYIIAGWTYSQYPEDVNVYLVKTNAHGDTLWTRSYGGSSREEGCSVQETDDGGYIIAGYTASLGAGSYDVYLIKTDDRGDTLWTKTYGGADNDRGYSVRQTPDGGYIIAGLTHSFGPGNAWLLRMNASGDTIWTRTYGGGFSEVRQTTDGGYVIAGTYGFDLLADVYLVKTDDNADVGAVTVLSPPGIAESGQVYLPTAVVRNFGLTPAVFPVTLEIGAGYAETMQETLASGISDTVVFPSWTADPLGSLAIKCYTSLVGDEDPANNTISDSIQVVPPPHHDVGAVAIISPSLSMRAGDTVIPQARIRNFGNRVERFFDVRLRIGAAYTRTVNVAEALLPDSTVEVTFPTWVAETGDWAVSCSTMLAGDADSTNDKVSSSLRVFEQTLAIEPNQSDRLEAGKDKAYRFYALIRGYTGGIVAVARPSPPPGWSARLCEATGVNDLTDTDSDGIPDLGYVAPGESGWFSLEVTAPSELRGDTASLSQVTFLLAGRVGGRPDIADTAVLSLTLLPELSIHNFPNPFSDKTSFVIGLPENGKASLTVYTRAGERVCRVLANADLPAGVHLVPWAGVNDNGRRIAPGTYEYLLDYVHADKTDRIRKKLVLTRQ
jgi:hypothetical protein